MTKIWMPEEGRWSALKKSWAAGENKARLIFLFLGSIPIFLFPGGEQAYYLSAQKHGDEAWLAPHNLWREVFHCLGGLLLILPFYAVRLAMLPVVCVTIFIGAICNEVFSDIPDSGLHIKNFVDVFCWCLGALFGGVFIFLMKGEL